MKETYIAKARNEKKKCTQTCVVHTGDISKKFSIYWPRELSRLVLIQDLLFEIFAARETHLLRFPWAVNSAPQCSQGKRTPSCLLSLCLGTVLSLGTFVIFFRHICDLF